MLSDCCEGTEKQFLEDIIAKHETPLFMYQSDAIVNNIVSLKNAFHSLVDVFYSFKANPNISICALMLRNGVHAEVCSYFELLMAKNVGFLPENIIFVGPGKSYKELEKAVEIGIFCIVIENVEELAILQSICKKLSKKARVAIRINPPFCVKEAPLKMGGVPTQFGITLEEIFSKTKAFQLDGISVIGLHVYNGTRILNAKSIAENCKKIFELVDDFTNKMGIELEFLDLGGGFGIPYFEGEKELEINSLKDEMGIELLKFKKKYPKSRLVVESGRYLVGNAGSFFSKVLYLKESFGKKFAITDGGMNCQLAATGIGSFLRRNFPISVLNRSTKYSEHYTVTGPLCTPSDIIGQDVLLPALSVGDIIQVGMSGAYGPSASPGLFLSHGFPEEVMIHEGKDFVIRKNDSYENVFGNHINIF